MSYHHHSKSNEAGNILIYILGAIFLLGILVVMVRGSSTPGSNIDRETLMIRVSEVQQYGQELERAVAYILQNGHSEADIRFAHPDADAAYGVITDTPSRQVFAVEGGGAKYREPPEDIQTLTVVNYWFFTGANSVGTVGSGDQGASSKTELLAILPYVSKEFCIEINNRNNVENPTSEPPQDDASMATNNIHDVFTGDYSWKTKIGDEPANLIQNTQEGCLEGSGSASPPTDTYHYYRVLLAR